MTKPTRFLDWLILAWLALAPALAAAHQVEHADASHGSDLSCLLCHAGDRDDDGLEPEEAAFVPPAKWTVSDHSVPAEALSASILFPSARAPPVPA